MTAKKRLVPELVSPAGDWPTLVTAVRSGADAVYFGLKDLSMRQAAQNFDTLELKKVMSLLHSNNRKGYLALNTIIYEKEREKLEGIIRQAKQAEVDAVICWDMAVVSCALKEKIPVHLSTQASVSNFAALRFFFAQGIRRFVLARECSLHDIEMIYSRVKREKMNCQLEAFVHGSMCVSVSGRCFFSHDLFGKSANRGECLQPCRREFLVKDAEFGTEYILGTDHIMSAKDLCMVEYIDKLAGSGISAFKIEGRMRTPEYVSTVTSVYRRAIDAYAAGSLNKPLKVSLKKELAGVYNRGFSEGFYFKAPGIDGLASGRSDFEKTFIGSIEKFYKKINVAQLVIRNEDLKEGGRILVYGKTTPATIASVTEIQIQHQPVKAAAKGRRAGVKLPFAARCKDKIFLLKEKK